MEIKDPKLLKENEEGILAGTSPAEEEEAPQEEGVALNNNTVPTVEEQENAGIVSEEAVPEEPVQESAPAMEQLSDETPLSEEIESQTQEGQIDPELGIAEGSATKSFTQSQVDEIAGKIRKETREKVTRSFFDRYGVNSEDELDDLFSDAQRYTTVQEMYDSEKKAWSEADAARNAELSGLKESVALLESGIDRNRYEDAKFILKGKGLEVTVENIEKELETHPEWKATAPAADANPVLPFRKAAAPVPTPAPQPGPATKISVLGNNGGDNPEPELSERERAMKLFKV